MPCEFRRALEVRCAHLTLQDRLVKELRLAGISSIEATNEARLSISVPVARCVSGQSVPAPSSENCFPSSRYRSNVSRRRLMCR